MGKKLKFEIEDKEYIIEYDRAIFMKMDKIGMSIASLQDKPLTFIETSFKFGLLKNQAYITDKQASRLYDKWLDEYGLEDFGEFVLDEYNFSFSTTQQDSEKPKKVWTIEE